MKDRNMYQRLQDLNEAIREWARGGRKGTAPRKVRANSSETNRASRLKRVIRDRKKRSITKIIQANRLAKGRNIRTG